MPTTSIRGEERPALSRRKESAEAEEEEGENEHTRRGTHTIRQYGEAEALPGIPRPRPLGYFRQPARLAGRSHAEVLRNQPPRLHGCGNPRRG